MKFLQVSALALASILPLPALSGDLAGSYLAARQALVTDDYDAAAQFYLRALGEAPNDPAILVGLIQAEVSSGASSAAVAPARHLDSMGANTQLSNMVLLVDDLARGDYDSVLARVENKKGAGGLLDGMLSAWAEIGNGDKAKAIAEFDHIGNQPGLERFARYQKALALAYSGDYEGAEGVYAVKTGAPLEMTRRSALARVEVLSQLGRNEDALSLIASLFGRDLPPEIQDLSDRLSAGDTLPFTFVASVQDGAAEILYSIATALQSEASYEYTLLYARLANALNADHIDSLLLTGDLLENLGRPELATRAYRAVPQNNPEFYLAELGRAAALKSSDRPNDALQVLERLASAYPTLPRIQSAKGDLYRQLGNDLEAVDAYSAALSLHGAEEQSQWFLYYARGMSQARLGNWQPAEQDFRTSLRLSPDQPRVLNYFGYSLVEKDENLGEALAMIERASQLSPSSGYIADSLGWALYRLDRAEDAVPHLERAAELMPVDATVNDHLGDVYWRVGRHLEARFQWQRALSCDPVEQEADRIRRKLQVGLDAVLADENHQFEQVARDGG